MSNFNLKLGSGIAFALFMLALPISRPVVSQNQIKQNTTVEDIAEDPVRLLGETLTVRGAVEEVDSGVSFLLKDEDLLGLIDDAEVLVINQTGAMLPIRPQDDIELQVTGQVERLTPEKMAELGLTASKVYSKYENRAVVVADSIALSLSPDEIFDRPEDYYYKPIAVKGEVEQIVGTNAFTIEDDEITDEIFGSKDLLVVNVDSTRPLESDGDVVVTGIVRPFAIDELERYYGLSLDAELRDEWETKYTDRPVLITTGVYPLNN